MHQNKILLLLLVVFINTTTISQTKHNRQSSQNIEESEVNDQKVEDLGHFLDNAIYTDNTEDYLSKLDKSAFSSFITKKTSSDASLSRYSSEFLKGFYSGLEALPKKLSAEVANGNYYDFLSYRYEPEEGTYYMLFRLFSQEGLNYHDYKVSVVDGVFKFSDMYVYLSGENMSQTLERLYIYAIPKNKLVTFFTGDDYEEFMKLAQGMTYHREGKAKQAYKLISSLKGDIAKDKFTLIIRSIIASTVNDEVYLKDLKTLIDAYPNDKTIYLNMIDYYTLTQDYDECIRLLETLESETDDDFLNYLKGNLMYESKNYKQAKIYYKYMVDNYEDFFEGYAGYLCVLSIEKSYDESIELLDTLEEAGYAKEDLVQFVEEVDEEGLNELQNLVDSKQFKTWKE